MNDSSIYYSVGALLYSPASNDKIAEHIANEFFGTHFSLSLCLEDTIRSGSVKDAEKILVNTLSDIYEKAQKKSFYIPKIFVRVRHKEQIKDLYERFGNSRELLKGFIFPKFTPLTADDFINEVMSLNVGTHTLYMMPIFENTEIIDPLHRAETLYHLKEKIDAVQEHILNIRVGGNDLCNAFGFRRHSNETIYHIRPIAHILTDIVTIYGRDYVISGPVWEYYNGAGWDTGLKEELHADRMMGFIGKTVIHPKQIALVNEAYRVTQADYHDAKAILNWDSDNLVAGSANTERMNEYKTHYRWAKKTLFLAENYGVVKA